MPDRWRRSPSPSFLGEPARDMSDRNRQPLASPRIGITRRGGDAASGVVRPLRGSGGANDGHRRGRGDGRVPGRAAEGGDLDADLRERSGWRGVAASCAGESSPGPPAERASTQAPGSRRRGEAWNGRSFRRCHGDRRPAGPVGQARGGCRRSLASAFRVGLDVATNRPGTRPRSGSGRRTNSSCPVGLEGRSRCR